MGAGWQSPAADSACAQSSFLEHRASRLAGFRKPGVPFSLAVPQRPLAAYLGSLALLCCVSFADRVNCLAWGPLC